MIDRFPRASRYNPEWVIAGVSGGANPLWITEWLAEALDLRPGMRVLDLGCGRAMSSIFLHREFGVEVWATDLWFSASENLQRIREAGRPTRHRRSRADPQVRRTGSRPPCCMVDPGSVVPYSAEWWRRHWERMGIVDIVHADSMDDGWRFWVDWMKLVAPDNRLEINALSKDAGKHMGYFRVVARRHADTNLPEPVTSVPTQYTKQPLLRDQG